MTPAAGSPARTAILDALRDTLRTTSRFKVAHLRTHGAWAFVRAGEVVRDGDAWQETDLFAEALLERRGARWTVVELWSLQDEDGAPRHDAFLGRVRRTLTSRGLPVALLPDDLRR